MSSSNRSLVVGLGLASLAVLASSCLDRPVAPAEPRTTNLVVRTVKQTFVDKIDLLFMIDNSISMSDKQDILERAVPVLVKRLVTPRCLDDAGNTVGAADSAGRCATGRPEFIPIKDIHLGVITSSLGSHGGTHCTDSSGGRNPDDRAELLPKARPAAGLDSWNQAGFLAWDPGQDRNTPPGETDVDALVQDFTAQVDAAGELGCGYESSLEAWYRFLVDPEPPVSVAKMDNFTAKGPINEPLLEQRRAFLRPDSLLAIVMLTDENDCSIVDEDGSQGFLISTNLLLPRASAACAVDPNDPCCRTCAVAAAEGCASNDEDAECSKKDPDAAYATLTDLEDNSNLRCFEQRRRFGFDLLYPTSRYVDGLTQRMVPDRAGNLVPNPIFSAPNGASARDESFVVLAGIVGVPWQDIATPESLTGPGLEYLEAGELAARGRWDLILGDPARGVPPSDPHMVESVLPRTGTNRLLGIPIAPPTSQNPRENPINGHEQNVPGHNDLQFACTFPLTTPRQCDATNTVACDCNADEFVNNRSLCSYPNGAGTHGEQHSAKAYPGLRHLEVLKGVGSNAIVASICPKNSVPAPGLLPEADPSYGYNPAVASIIDVIGERVGQQCLGRKLTPDTNPDSATFGQVPCVAVEAILKTDTGCACDATMGRTPVEEPTLASAVSDELRANDHCGEGPGTVPCDAYCVCKVDQLSGAELSACQAGSVDPALNGYCYVDAEQGIGDPAIVERCPATQRRVLRFVGAELPANGAIMLMACLGASL